MAHFTCVGATVDELRATLDRMRDAGHRERARAARRPARGPGRVDGDRGRPELLARADRADPRRLRLRDRRGVLPGGRTSTPSRAESDLRYLQGEGRRRRALPDHAAVLRQRRLLRLRRPGARRRHRRPDHPGDHADHRTSTRSSASRRCAARRSPTRLLRELELRADQPDAVADFGVAYATLQCADLLANGAPGIHFYTLNRSPSTRAILGALRAMAPWRQRVAA